MISILLFKQIVQLFMMILMGWIIVKAGIMKSEDSRYFSLLLLYLVMPCVIINSFLKDFSTEVLHGVILSIIAAVIANALIFLVVYGVRRPLRLSEVEQAASLYPNCANLIVPIVTAILGPEWVIYTSGFILVQTVLLWSHGRILLSGQKQLSVKGLLCNINIISIGVGLVLFLVNPPLPEFITGTIQSVTAAVGPLSMIVAGMLIAGMDVRKSFTYPGIWKIVALRLIVCPLPAVLVLKFSPLASFVPDGDLILLISLLAAAAPSAAAVTNMAQVYHRNAYYASASYVITTLLCIITMPLWVAVYQL